MDEAALSHGRIEMRTALEELVEKLEKAGAACLRGFRPGLSHGEIVRALARVGLEPSAQVIDWYAWCNGSNGVGTFGRSSLIEAFWPVALDDALEARRIGIAIRGIQSSALPIAENGGGDYLSVDCAVEDGPVIRDAKDGEPIQIYDSVEQMVVTLSEGLDSGAVTVQSDGALDFDFDAYGDLARSLNPRSAYWT
jgi:hypothetical protein